MVLNVAALNIIVVIGLNLLMGYAGQISLACSLFGLEPISLVFLRRPMVSCLAALILAFVVTGAVAYAIGIPR